MRKVATLHCCGGEIVEHYGYANGVIQLAVECQPLFIQACGRIEVAKLSPGIAQAVEGPGRAEGVPYSDVNSKAFLAELRRARQVALSECQDARASQRDGSRVGR